jgi:hypothetical protein
MKYVWWQSAEAAIEYPDRVLAAAMNLATIEDCRRLLRDFQRDRLIEVVRSSAPGWFSAKAWSFWHRILGVTNPEERVPPLPQRSLR